MGLTITKHYCGGHLVSSGIKVLIVDDHDYCCGDKEMPEDCCRDEIEFYQLDEKYHQPQLSIINYQLSIINALVAYIVLDEHIGSLDTHSAKYLSYKPPILSPDIPVLFQSFLC